MKLSIKISTEGASTMEIKDTFHILSTFKTISQMDLHMPRKEAIILRKLGHLIEIKQRNY